MSDDAKCKKCDDTQADDETGLCDLCSHDEVTRLREWLSRASQFELNEHVVVDRMTQQDGSVLWRVKKGPFCLNVNGEYEYEPLPSSRDDAYIKRCRFATLEEAWERAERAGGTKR